MLKLKRCCNTINACISDLDTKKKFCLLDGNNSVSMLSGLVEKYDNLHIRRINSYLNTYKDNIDYIEVDCFKLNTVLEKYGINNIDYLSLDTEGGELDILGAIDFNKIYIKVIGVENNYKYFDIPNLLIEKGYELIAILGVDEIYLKK